MKEKNKKILKGLGVGALACVAMVGLTGCANISNTDYDRMMETVETVENTISDLEAAKVFNNAMNKIINSSSDFWNNMKVETTLTYIEDGEKFVENSETYVLQNDNQQIALRKSIGETDTFANNWYSAVYTLGEKTYSIDKEIDGFHKSESTTTFVDECLEWGMLDYFNVGIRTESEFIFNDATDIVGASKNEQGNYVITTIHRYVYSEFGHTGIESYTIHNEIDGDYNLISQTIEVEFIDREYVMNGTIINVYSYENVEYSDIQEEFEALVNYEEPAPGV